MNMFCSMCELDRKIIAVLSYKTIVLRAFILFEAFSVFNDIIVKLKYKNCAVNDQPSTNEVFVPELDPEPGEKYELKAPPLPPRRSSAINSISESVNPSGSTATLYQTDTSQSSSATKDHQGSATRQDPHPHRSDHRTHRSIDHTSRSSIDHTHRPSIDHTHSSNSLLSSNRDMIDHLPRGDGVHRPDHLARGDNSHRPEFMHRGDSLHNISTRDHTHREHLCRGDSLHNVTIRERPHRERPPELPPKLPSRSSAQFPLTPTLEADLPPRLPPRPAKGKGIERLVLPIPLWGLGVQSAIFLL